MLTDEQLREIMPQLSVTRRGELLPFLQTAMAEFAIGTAARMAAFLAQLAHESGQLRFMEEIWGPTAAQKRYEPPSSLATRLGNTEPGDGKRFKGRGPIQITGRANYRRFGGLLGIDLVSDPARAAVRDLAFRIAGLFWAKNGLNELADLLQRGRFSRDHEAHQRRPERPRGSRALLRRGTCRARSDRRAARGRRRKPSPDSRHGWDARARAWTRGHPRQQDSWSADEENDSRQSEPHSASVLSVGGEAESRWPEREARHVDAKEEAAEAQTPKRLVVGKIRTIRSECGLERCIPCAGMKMGCVALKPSSWASWWRLSPSRTSCRGCDDCDDTPTLNTVVDR